MVTGLMQQLEKLHAQSKVEHGCSQLKDVVVPGLTSMLASVGRFVSSVDVQAPAGDQGV